MSIETHNTKARSLRFHDLLFDEELLGAERDDGSKLRFTRHERALLSQFVSHPHRLLSRDQLLSALSNDPADQSDRNIDFIVNRLRRKLSDTARKPRFIATQYGEGYVWIAAPRSSSPDSTLLVLGPIRGAAEVVGRAEAQQFVQRLQRALEERTAPGRAITRPHWRGGSSGPACRFSLEVSFRLEHDALQAVLSLRGEPGRDAVGVWPVNAAPSLGDAEAGALANTLLAAIWRRLVVPTDGPSAPTDAPLAVRIHDAAQLLSATDENWARIAPKLAADRAADLDDPHAALIWAVYQQTRLIRIQAGDPADPATYGPVEDEIEGLVFAHLPALRAKPAFALSAANLLISVHRGHEDFAEDLVRSVLADTPAYAMALPILAQIDAKRGALDQAVARLKEALGLCDPETETEVFLLVIMARILNAADDREAAQAAFDRMRHIKPLAGHQLGVFLSRPGEEHVSPDLRRRLDAMSADEARRLLGGQYYINGRRFGLPAHRLNIMAGPRDLLVRRFGENVMPPAVAEAIAADESAAKR